jgi:hypothetical protein
MITLAEALAQTEDEYRYLLLGNGFSISLFPTCFSYASLFKEAQIAGLFDALPEIEKAFDLLGTSDFELVMETLKSASKLVPLYGGDAAKMQAHSEALKEVLVQAISGRHPARPNDISEDQYQNCRAFLAEFIGVDRPKKGRVFSLNYDLLLYWSLLHDIVGYQWDGADFVEVPDQVLNHDDGFRALEDDPDAEYVAWQQFDASHGQTITFLRGALHLYERGPDLAKLCWERSGNVPLMDQIRKSLDQDLYPVFVSEGTSSKKMRAINRSAYLSKAIRTFDGCCSTKQASLFIIGHSLADSDDHILRRIKNGKVRRCYISLFGDFDAPHNVAIRAKATYLAAQRPERNQLHVEYVDAASLHIWSH